MKKILLMLLLIPLMLQCNATWGYYTNLTVTPVSGVLTIDNMQYLRIGGTYRNTNRIYKTYTIYATSLTNVLTDYASRVDVETTTPTSYWTDRPYLQEKITRTFYCNKVDGNYKAPHKAVIKRDVKQLNSTWTYTTNTYTNIAMVESMFYPSAYFDMGSFTVNWKDTYYNPDDINEMETITATMVLNADVVIPSGMMSDVTIMMRSGLTWKVQAYTNAPITSVSTNSTFIYNSVPYSPTLGGTTQRISVLPAQYTSVQGWFPEYRRLEFVYYGNTYN